MFVGKIFRQSISLTLGLALVAALVCAGPAGADVIDFTNTTGYGLSADRVMIEDIRYDAYVTNPFDPTHPTITSYFFNVPFRFDMTTLHLIPDLGTLVSVDSNTACSSLTVNVSDAYTGLPLSGALVLVGLSSAYTNAAGVATFSGLTYGNNQITGIATDHVSASRVVNLTCGANSVGLALNPSSGSGSLSANEIRVILTWGANPSDLDSHLTGPTANSTGTGDTTNRFHVYYVTETTDVAELDVDDVTSFGPETITISPPGSSSTLRPGLYRYSVHHYSGSSNITNSGASVSLRIGNNPPRNYTPPAGGTSANDVWTVFELIVGSNNTVSVYDVNTITHNTSPSAVRGTNTGLGAVETGIDFTRLPAK